MDKTEYLLTCLVEECCELGQRATKALRFGLDEVQPGQELNNKQRLLDEWADLRGVMRLLWQDGPLKTSNEEGKKGLDKMMAKGEKLKKFMKYSEECGTLKLDV